MKTKSTIVFLVSLIFCSAVEPSQPDVNSKLDDFDSYVEKLLKDWNAPGVAIGIVAGHELIYAKGYGYRDYEKKLPFTTKTLFPIASNTKLFTAVAAGMLVEEGKLEWDKPVRESVPSIEFYNNELNTTVSLKDMLAHRTGISRHDMIWYRSDFSRKELYERLRFLKPQQGIREGYLYNNMMYAAVGHIIELKSSRTWEDFVRERIFSPLKMENTVFSIEDMLKNPDHAVPFTEKREGNEIYRIPYYEETQGAAPAASIISNIEEMSHWLIALMNNGNYGNESVLPAGVLKNTMTPAIPVPNLVGESMGFWELLNEAHGMGRFTASYRGRLITYSTGHIDGFFSHISFMPHHNIGVIVFVIGDHCVRLDGTISYNIYERLLGMDPTPWSQRWLKILREYKEEGQEGRAKAGEDRVAGTQPSHPLDSYAGAYEHPAYGLLKIRKNQDGLQFDFRKMQLPLKHFHYDRFDTPDHERYGKWSVNFFTNPQGDIDKAALSLDEAEVIFVRKTETLDAALLRSLAGIYETTSGFHFEVLYKEGDNSLALVIPGQPEEKLIPYKGLSFRTKRFADFVYEFVMQSGRVKALKQRSPSGEYVFVRK